MSTQPPPHSGPSRPYDSLFTPRQTPPAFPSHASSSPPSASVAQGQAGPAGPSRPYDSLHTPKPTAGNGAWTRAWRRFKYANAPILPPGIASRIAKRVPLWTLIFFGYQTIINETLRHKNPALVESKKGSGRLEWAGPASWGIVGYNTEKDGDMISPSRIKWVLSQADVILNSEATRTSNLDGPVSQAQTWLAGGLGKVLPPIVVAMLTPFARRPWDQDESESRPAAD